MTTANKAATKIQTAFRKRLIKKKQNSAATKIQKVVRGRMSRMKFFALPKNYENPVTLNRPKGPYVHRIPIGRRGYSYYNESILNKLSNKKGRIINPLTKEIVNPKNIVIVRIPTNATTLAKYKEKENAQRRKNKLVEEYNSFNARQHNMNYRFPGNSTNSNNNNNVYRRLLNNTNQAFARR
jgi:hypothetical protein